MPGVNDLGQSAGIWGGISQGLQNGLLAYQQQKQQNFENDQQMQKAQQAKQVAQIDAANKGLLLDSEGKVQQDYGGGLLRTPEYQEQQKLTHAQNVQGLSEADPSSPKNVAAREQAKAAYMKRGHTKEEAAAAFSDDMTSGEISKGPAFGLMKNDADNELRLKIQELKNEANGGKSEKKATNDQNKAYTELITKAEGGRGTPQDVTQARKNLQSVANIEALIKDYPDLNKMPTSQANLFNAELAKISTGGAPTEGARHELGSDSYESRFQNFMSKVGNKPEPAQLGAFIQENIPYIQGLKKVSNDIYGEHVRTQHEAFADRISPDHETRFKQKYSKYLNPVDEAPRGLIGARGAVSSDEHNEAITWAKSNPNDPRSAAILKANGL